MSIVSKWRLYRNCVTSPACILNCDNIYIYNTQHIYKYIKFKVSCAIFSKQFLNLLDIVYKEREERGDSHKIIFRKQKENTDNSYSNQIEIKKGWYLPAMATNKKNIHVSMSLPVEKKPPLLAGKARLSITHQNA